MTIIPAASDPVNRGLYKTQDECGFSIFCNSETYLLIIYQMDITITIIAAVVSLVAGALIAWLSTRKNNQAIVSAAEEKANAIVKEAEAKGEILLKDKMMEAKERFYQLKNEHEKHIAEKDKSIQQSENRIKQKEGNLERFSC